MKFRKNPWPMTLDDLSDVLIHEESFRLIVANAVFEHVRQPFHAAESLSRLLCLGGVCYVEIPFLWGFHPYKGYTDKDGLLPTEPDLPADGRHGGDYWRFTPQGVALLFDEWLDVQDIFQAQGGGLIYVGKRNHV